MSAPSSPSSSAAGSGAWAGAAAGADAAPPRRADRSSPPNAAGSSEAGAAAWPCWAANSSCNLERSNPPAAGAAGAAAAAVRESRLNSSSAGLGLGWGLGSYYSSGEFLRSIAFSRVFTAFSIIGSTSCSMPSRLSKSCTAGIIFERLCIFENTLTSGWLSSNLFKILLVKAF